MINELQENGNGSKLAAYAFIKTHNINLSSEVKSKEPEIKVPTIVLKDGQKSERKDNHNGRCGGKERLSENKREKENMRKRGEVKGRKQGCELEERRETKRRGT